jgi:hypothetical protein
MALGFQRSRALFNQLDTNHDHLIDIREFLAQAQQLGLDGSLDLQEVFDAADLDHSANIGAAGDMHWAHPTGLLQHVPLCSIRQPLAASPMDAAAAHNCHTAGQDQVQRDCSSRTGSTIAAAHAGGGTSPAGV